MTASSISEAASDGGKLQRAFSSKTAKWQRFENSLMVASEKVSSVNKDNGSFAYQRQYSHVYSHRLKALKPQCWATIRTELSPITATLAATSPAKASMSSPVQVNRVLELREGVPSVLVGTIVREIVDVKDDLLLEGNRCRKSDQLYLEDESGRVALKASDDDHHSYCTGIVMGAMGTLDEFGTLMVSQFFPPAPAASVAPVAKSDDSQDSDDPHLMLVSGFLCGDPHVSSLPREMLLCYLQGQFTADAKKISRIIVVGPLFSITAPLDGIKEFDAWVTQLVDVGIPVDVIPAKTDPTTSNWPQRSLHSSLMPKSSNSAITSRTPNPYASIHSDKMIIGTDGANVEDLLQSILVKDDQGNFTTISEVEALRKTLEWRHMCPTGPDSLPTVPHIKSDPMVLDDVPPHVYFTGNASKFATNLIASTNSTNTNTNKEDKTKILCIPSFAKSGEAVLLNLRNLEVELLSFDDDSF